MFWWSGNVWEVHVIEQIMLVGVGLSAVSILPMFLFNDDKTLGADSDAYQELLTIEGDPGLPGLCLRKSPMGSNGTKLITKLTPG